MSSTVYQIAGYTEVSISNFDPQSDVLSFEVGGPANRLVFFQEGPDLLVGFSYYSSPPFSTAPYLSPSCRLVNFDPATTPFIAGSIVLADGTVYQPGTGNSDSLVGTTGSDYFDFSAGGADTLRGEPAENAYSSGDVFWGGTALTAADSLIGSAGQYDTLYLNPPTSGGQVVLAADHFSGIEKIVGLSTGGTGSLDLKLDTGVTGLQSVDAASFTNTEQLKFDSGATYATSLTLKGGSGADSLLAGAAADTLTGGKGADYLAGAGGNDVLRGDASSGFETSDFGADTLDGGEGDDQLTGDFGADSLLGGGGNDTLLGDLTEDYYNYYLQLPAGAANDTLWGGSGNDSLFSGIGEDSLAGDDGDDTLHGGFEADTLRGGSGNDVFVYTLLIGGASTNRSESSPTTIDLIEDFVSGSDKLSLPEKVPGTTRYLVFNPEPVAFSYTGGSSGEQSGAHKGDGFADVLWRHGAGQTELWIDINDDAQFGDADLLVYLPGGPTTLLATDFATAFSALRGTTGNDTLSGGAEGNYGKGLEGNDALYGNAGSDTLDGGGGDDSLSGGALYDSLLGGQGNDTLDGGADSDYLYADYEVYSYPEPPRDGVGSRNLLYGGLGDDRLTGGAGRDTLIGGTANVEDDPLDDMDFLDGYGGDDLLEGRGGGDNLRGGAGNDTLRGGLGGDGLFGGGGADELDGGDGDDLLDGSRGNYDEGALGSDTLRGGTGNDTLYASDGNSLLEGGEGQDELWGENSNYYFGSNNNTLVGGAGSDTFYLLRTKGSTVTGDGVGVPDSVDYFVLASSADVGAQYSGYRYTFEAGATSVEGPNVITDFQQGTDLLVTGVTNGQSYRSNIPFVFGGEAPGFTAQPGTSLTGLDPRFLTLVFFHAGTGGGAYTGVYMDTDRDGTVSASDFLLKLSGTLVLTKADFSAGTFTLKTGDAGNNLDTDPALTAGTDLAFGFGGNDNFQGLGGRDTLNGDGGNDTLVAGEDPFAGLQDVALFGGAGNDSIRGGDYADILVGGRGSDCLEGGGSTDRMYAAGAADSTTFDVNFSWYYTAAEDEGARNTLIGGTGGDTLYGSDAADSLVGGPDTFPGYVYDSDYLYGGLGDDTLVGGVEGDYLYAGPGSDRLLGGEGHDLLAGNRWDQYEDPSEVGDDTLTGGDGNDTLIASGGHDSLDGGAGDDSLLGINVSNRYGYLVTEGPTSSTYLAGGAGNDVLTVGNVGDGGRDTLDGGAGNDRLVLTHYGTGSESTYSRGADVTGGADADTFEFHVVESSPLVDRDVLLDFSFAQGDRLKLDVGYYAEAKPLLWRGAAPAGFDATAILSAPTVPLAAPSPAGGSFNELWTFTKSGSTYLYVDRNADGLVDPRDLLIEFRNGASLSPAAFVPGTFTIAVGTSGDDNNDTPEIDPPLGDGNDIVFALAGNDSLDGLGGNDTLNGDAGNDTLLGGEGQDYLYGGAGNDSLSAGGGSFGQLAGGEGNDTLLGGDLEDTLYAEGQSASTATAPYATDASGSRNWLVGGLGNDNLYGGHGHDTLEGGAGNDYLYGRGGSDTLLGGADNDVLHGDDIVYYAEPFAADSMDGGSGEDQLTLTGADTLIGGLGNDSFDLTGDNGQARALLSGGDGATPTADDGADLYRIYTYNNGYYYSLAALQLSPVSNPITVTDFDFAHGDRLDTGLTEFMRSQGFPGDAPYRWRGEINLIGYSGSDYSLVNNGFNPDLRFNEFWTFSLPSSLVPDFLRNGLEGDPNHPPDVSWLFMDRDRDGVVETTDFLMRFENGVALSEDAFSAGTFSTLYGTAGNDPSLSGTEGDNVAYAFAGNDSMFGGGGNDLLNGDEGRDTLDGDLGADALLGGAGADCLQGGLGNDTLIGSPGSDTLEGGDEADQLYAEGASSAVSRTNLFSSNQFDLSTDTNVLDGGAGNDTLYGGRGNDSLFGGGDDDQLEARSPYFDSLAGADGNDLLSGGDGNDLLIPDGGNDTLDGGAGSDKVWFQPWAYIEGYVVADFTVKATLAEGVSAGAATVQYRLEPGYGGGVGGQNPDLVKTASYLMLGVENLKGYYDNDSLVGNSDANLLDGGSGGFDTLRGGAGNDTLVGSYQGAVADFSDHAVGVYVDLSFPDFNGRVTAYTGGDFFNGSPEDTLQNITGLYGGSGADTLYGDSRDNVLRGGPGLDILLGGGGNDTADYSDRSQSVSITLADGFSFTSAFVGSALDDTLDGIENLIGGGGNDSLAGNSGVNRLEGGAGNDTLQGDGGDSLVGGLGGDLFRVAFIDQGFVTVTDFGPGDRLQVVPDGTNVLPLSGTPAIGSGLGLARGTVAYTDYGTWVQLHVGLDDTPDGDLDIALLGNFQGRTFRISSNAVVLNNSPTGEVLIAGDYTVGQTLTASNTLVDADGIPGTIVYQWNANGLPIQGATGSTFKLTSAQIGTEITVTASYTDGAGTKESVTSYALPPVEAGNAPQAVADYLSGTEDQTLELMASILLANDTGGTSALKIASVSNGTGGTVRFKDGTVSFTPQANFYGDATFGYTVSDGTTTSQAGTVTVHLAPVNDAPTGAFAGSLPGGEEDIEYVVDAFDLLEGFVDVDDDALAVTHLIADRGTVTDNGDCTFTITPDENYFGPVKLAWRVEDGHGGSVPGTAPTSMALKYRFDNGGTNPTFANPGLNAAASQVPASVTGAANAWTVGSGAITTLKGNGAANSAGAIAAVGWKAGNSFEFTLQVAAGYELDVTGLSFLEQGSSGTEGNGPSNWTVTANGNLLACGHATVGGASLGSHDSTKSNTGTYTLSANEQLTGTVKVVIAAYGASNDDKATWRIDDFALQGTVRRFSGATTLTVASVNDAPTAKDPYFTPSAGKAYVPVAINLADLFFDPDPADTLEISVDAVNFPTWLTFDEDKGVLGGLLTNRDFKGSEDPVVVEVTVSASDGIQDSAPAVQTFVITVAPNRDVVGTGGNDDLFGTSLADTLNGLEGNDTLEGGAGNDALVGGGGNDTVVYAAALAAVSVDLGAAGTAKSTAANNAAGIGLDALTGVENAVGSSFSDALTGSSAANLLQGGGGNDSLTGLEGADTLEGGAGNDTYVVRVGTTGLEDVVRETADNAQIDTLVVVKVSSTQVSGAINLATGDLVNVENINASGTSTISVTLAGNARPNNLTGNDGPNSLTGLAGNDTLVGAGGNDTLDGGANNDSLSGGVGNDSIVDAAGNDTYDGGTGTDIVSYAAAKAAVTVDLALTAGAAKSTAGNDAAGIGIDSITGIENVVGSGFNDMLKGTTGANLITGGGGADSLFAGVDNVRDTFVFLAATDSKAGASLRDKISNFVTGKAATTDLLDLRLIDANASSKATGDQAFKFGGTTAAANSVWFTTTGNDCLVQADVTGDKTADFEVLLLGTKTLAAENLLL